MARDCPWLAEGKRAVSTEGGRCIVKNPRVMWVVERWTDGVGWHWTDTVREDKTAALAEAEDDEQCGRKSRVVKYVPAK